MCLVVLGSFWTRGVAVLTHLMLHISVRVAALVLAEAWQ